MTSEITNREQEEVVKNNRSPLSLQSLKNLWFRPNNFFSNSHGLFNKPEVLLVAWVSGIAYAMNKIDTNIMKAELGKARSSGEAFGPWLTESWICPLYWLNEWPISLVFWRRVVSPSIKVVWCKYC